MMNSDTVYIGLEPIPFDGRDFPMEKPVSVDTVDPYVPPAPSTGIRSNSVTNGIRTQSGNLAVLSMGPSNRDFNIPTGALPASGMPSLGSVLGRAVSFSA